MCFEIVDDYSLADVAFRAYGKELSELFKNSAFAIIAIIVQNVEQISREIVKCIDLENADITLLFYEYLQEFLFYKDSSSLLLIADSVHICETTRARAIEKVGVVCETGLVHDSVENDFGLNERCHLTLFES